jgi:ABC-type transporter Mla subunit MlaD
MDTLLMVAVVLIALAIIVQAGVLVGMYLISRRVTEKVNVLMDDSRTLIGPLQTVTTNLKTTTDELAEVGKIARDQAHAIEQTLNETRETIRVEVQDIRDRVVDTVETARATIMRPVHTWSAVIQGIGEGLRTFFRQEPETMPVAEQPVAEVVVKQETPAA